MRVQQRLGELGVTLPEAAVPVANYVPAIRSGNYIYTPRPRALVRCVHQASGDLAVTRPEVAVPVPNYVPAIRSGTYIYTSGQLPLVDGALAATGQLGPQSSVDDAAAAARVCALNAIAAAAGV